MQERDARRKKERELRIFFSILQVKSILRVLFWSVVAICPEPSYTL